MAKSIFTPFQKGIFEILSQNEFVCKYFYFSGGTALSEFYLQHRVSEDFDFFTAKKISFEDVRVNLEEAFRKIGIDSLEYREELSAKIFFLKRGKKEVVKTDFNYFPFKPLKTGKIFKGIRIDSLFDIAVNKLHTILTRVNARDFVDFYFIQKKENYKIDFLLKNLQKKFSWNVDPLFLGSRLTRADEVKDFPKMIIDFSKKDFVNYFKDLAKISQLIFSFLI